MKRLPLVAEAAHPTATKPRRSTGVSEVARQATVERRELPRRGWSRSDLGCRLPVRSGYERRSGPQSPARRRTSSKRQRLEVEVAAEKVQRQNASYAAMQLLRLWILGGLCKKPQERPSLLRPSFSAGFFKGAQLAVGSVLQIRPAYKPGERLLTSERRTNGNENFRSRGVAR
jgi:hypothetical protein